mgnify:CR=1 FL=1
MLGRDMEMDRLNAPFRCVARHRKRQRYWANAAGFHGELVFADDGSASYNAVADATTDLNGDGATDDKDTYILLANKGVPSAVSRWRAPRSRSTSASNNERFASVQAPRIENTRRRLA